MAKSPLDDGNKLMSQGTKFGVSALRETILHVLTTSTQSSWSAGSAIRSTSSTNWSIFVTIVASGSSAPSNRKFYPDRPKLGYFSILKIGFSHGSGMGVLKYPKLINLFWFAPADTIGHFFWLDTRLGSLQRPNGLPHEKGSKLRNIPTIVDSSIHYPLQYAHSNIECPITHRD